MHGNPVAMGVMIGLDDIARIDGIVGCVDFVGADIIILVHYCPVKAGKSVFEIVET